MSRPALFWRQVFFNSSLYRVAEVIQKENLVPVFDEQLNSVKMSIVINKSELEW